jgi:hypothetical protein
MVVAQRRDDQEPVRLAQYPEPGLAESGLINETSRPICLAPAIAV